MEETPVTKDPDARARIDWIEKAAIENMKTQHVFAENLAKDSATTLIVVLAAMGGGLAYAAKAIDANAWTWLSVGASAFTIWTAFVSWQLVTKCMMFTDLPQIYNEPRSFEDPKMEALSFDDLRWAEIRGLQNRIDKSLRRNVGLSDKLNRVRKLAVASPLVFLIFSVGWVAVRAAMAASAKA